MEHISRKPKQYYKMLHFGLEKKIITMHLCIDRPEIILAIDFAWEEKKKS